MNNIQSIGGETFHKIASIGLIIGDIIADFLNSKKASELLFVSSNSVNSSLETAVKKKLSEILQVPAKSISFLGEYGDECSIEYAAFVCISSSIVFPLNDLNLAMHNAVIKLIEEMKQYKEEVVSDIADINLKEVSLAVRKHGVIGDAKSMNRYIENILNSVIEKRFVDKNINRLLIDFSADVTDTEYAIFFLAGDFYKKRVVFDSTTPISKEDIENTIRETCMEMVKENEWLMCGRAVNNE